MLGQTLKDQTQIPFLAAITITQSHVTGLINTVILTLYGSHFADEHEQACLLSDAKSLLEPQSLGRC